MTIAELIGPNIKLNKRILTKIGLTNHVIPFILSYQLDSYNIFGLKHRNFSLSDLNLGIRPKKPTNRIINPILKVYYLENITDDQIKRLLELKYGDTIRDLDELKVELL